MKHIIVTGGAGFLGSNLCSRLINDGHKVYCIDNCYTGNVSNIKNLLKNPNFSFINHDIETKMDIDVKIDQIYNLACPASPPSYQKSPTTTIKTNVLGMINMLDLAQKNQATILQASTSEVYGDPLIHPQSETYNGNVNPIGIRACYDEGKRCAEALCFDYNREFGTNIKVIRIFNTYGPNMDPQDGRVISNFIMQALNNKNITIYGDGHQTRSFCYVDDLIDGMIKMMNSENNFIGPVNLGNPEEFTVLELAKKVISLINSKSNIIHLAAPKDDPMRRKPSIALAVERLGWKPSVPLEIGLIRTIEYFTEINKKIT